MRACIPCPVCGTNVWDVPGLEVAPGFIAGPGVANGTFHNQVGMPVVAMICITCSYVRRFVWVPWRKAERHDESPCRPKPRGSILARVPIAYFNVRGSTSWLCVSEPSVGSLDFDEEVGKPALGTRSGARPATSGGESDSIA